MLNVVFGNRQRTISLSASITGILNECWHPARRRTIGDMVATGEELMTPVSARGRRSAVMVILVLEDEPPLIMLCQQHCSNLNVYLIPGLGAVNINESSPRDQSSAALKAMHLPCKSLRLLVKLQPTLQYKYAGTVIVPCFAIVASSQKALLPKERLDAIWWEISICAGLDVGFHDIEPPLKCEQSADDSSHTNSSDINSGTLIIFNMFPSGHRQPKTKIKKVVTGIMDWFIILKGSIDVNVLIIIQFQNMMIQAVNNKTFMLSNYY